MWFLVRKVIEEIRRGNIGMRFCFFSGGRKEI